MAGIAKKVFSPIAGLFGIGGGGSGAEANRNAPTPDDKLSRAKRERETLNRYGSTGRVSTLLDDGKLG